MWAAWGLSPRAASGAGVVRASVITLRVAGRLHHISVSRTYTGTRVLVLVQDLNFRILNAATGEAASLYQLMIRSFGTNYLPDCSNMCHESSGQALIEAIGIGKGSVTVDDMTHADLIVIAEQNPGTNHPRMLSVLEKAKANGAKIIAVNPLPEAGLIRFKDPQKVHGVVGHGVPIADEFVQIHLGGDMALFAGLGRLLLEADDRAAGTVVDREFIAAHCANFDAYEAQTRAVDIDTVLQATGIGRAQLDRVAQMMIASDRTIACWAMGLNLPAISN